MNYPLERQDERSICYRKLCDVGRENGAATARINEINQTLHALITERRLLKSQREERTKNAQAHVEPYSKNLMLPLVTMMHEVLPREVRDMIYDNLLSSERSGTTANIKRAWKTAHFNGMYGPREHRWISTRLTVDGQCLCFPHIIRPEYVSLEVAREIVEAWYRRNSEMGNQNFSIYTFDREAIERLVCEDVFRVKLDPTTVIRALSLGGFIARLAIGTNRDEFPTATARQQALEPLYRIKNKSGFNLDIEVYQRHIRLNLWHDIFDTFKPVLDRVVNKQNNQNFQLNLN